MTPTLSVLACSVTERAGNTPVIDQLHQQAVGHPVEVLILTDNRAMTIGAKRNHLVNIATGDYVVFVDDDDMIADDYVTSLLDAARTGADVLTFRMDYIRNGTKHWTVHHSIGYKDTPVDPARTYTKPILNTPRHTSAVRRAIAQQLPYQDTSYGEDADWATRLLAIATSECVIDKTLYYYLDTPGTSIARQYANPNDPAYKEWAAEQK